jgi:hypothetical protein
LVIGSGSARNIEMEDLAFTGQEKLWLYGEEIMKKFLASLVVVIIVFIACVAFAQSKPPLRLVQTIPLPDLKEGDFDHFAGCFSPQRLIMP